MNHMPTVRIASLLSGALLLLGGCVPAWAASPQMRLTRETPGPAPANLMREWKPVLSHTHNLRGGGLSFEEAKVKLVDWCRRLGVAALGVGSPWEPVSRAAYLRFEGADRDLYYSGRIDPQSVMHRDQIGRMLQDLNGLSGGATLFYLDNETPKCRYGHVWWFGYDYDVPAWHDYSQDRPIEYWENDSEREINSITGQPHRRRCLLEIMARQRKAGALGVFAHPTSWWTASDGRFVTNIASECALFLMAEGYLDGFTAMGYDACHRAYQSLWFELLDTGAIVPGFAETDYALDNRRTYDNVRTFLSFLHAPGETQLKRIVAAAREGACFMSTGAFLIASVDGVPMGRVATTRSGLRHRLRIEAYPGKGQARFSRIDVAGKGGAILARKNSWPGGILEYEFPGRDEADYIVVRAFGQNDNPDAPSQKDIEHMAMTNPVYLHPRGFRFQPVQTECIVQVQPGSAWEGGALEFQTAGGETIARHPIRAGAIKATLPASARVSLTKAGIGERCFYIAMENPKVQRLLTYLYRGEFRKDYGNPPAGNVSPAAFRLGEMREALRQFVYVLR